MLKSHYSWYLHIKQPKAIVIGPHSSGDKNWRELAPVATPRERYNNPFYMEAECACVMNLHEIDVNYDSRNKNSEAVHYTNINYEVPGNPLHREPQK